MWALLVVRSEVLVKALPGVAAVVVTLDIHFLVFERTPQTLGENIVDGSSLAVHAQVDALSGDLLRKGQGGKLRPLVGVDDARLEHGASLLQRLEAKGDVQAVGQFPREHKAAVPVQERHEVQEPALERCR